ncbi:MAG: hypothetical protein JO316_09475 [Abitibacteriaceae bacterium]|nr:hypothetical protein [Abditibacteriaceae bacterium]MBV9865568.1 hypothetical protein [Abditibacteriaceae bacterium]
MKSHSLEEVRAVKPQALKLFKPLAAVVGVGITRVENGYGLKINLQQQPPPGVTLPTEVAGVPV